MNPETMTTVAALGMLVAPTALELAEARAADAREPETACVARANARVERRLGGEADIAARLRKGTEVTVLEARDDRTRIRYPREGRKHVGWIRSGDLEACDAEPPDSGETDPRESPPQNDGVRNFHPFGRPVGRVPGGVLLQKLGYDCMHDPALLYCRWVGYCFQPGSQEVLARFDGEFVADRTRALATRTAVPEDYEGAFKQDQTGFDRGHMAPDASIKVLGEAAQAETYSLANITPQFTRTNRRIWAQLESAIRDWATENAPVCVETGPVFEEGRPIQRLAGPNRLQVPHAYYAIVTRGSATEPDTISFIIPNEINPRSFSEVMELARSVDDVERATKLDFLAELEDGLEGVVEEREAEELW